MESSLWLVVMPKHVSAGPVYTTHLVSGYVGQGFLMDGLEQGEQSLHDILQN